MQLKCINNFWHECSLTVGKVYNSVDDIPGNETFLVEERGLVKIDRDNYNNRHVWIYKSYFIDVMENRNNKINKILCN